MRSKTPKNIEVYGRRPNDRFGGLTRCSRGRWSGSEWVSAADRLRFPSVLLQPLGHLSVSFKSAVYRPMTEPANPIVTWMLLDP